MILAYLAVDLAVGRLLLVGIILDQTSSKLAVGVCGRIRSFDASDKNITRKVKINRPPFVP